MTDEPKPLPVSQADREAAAATRKRESMVRLFAENAASAARDDADRIEQLEADKAKLREALEMARGCIRDLRKGFAMSVSPERWVEQVIAPINTALQETAR